jgi:hypothetical protein
MIALLISRWSKLSGQIERARERRFLREARRAMGSCSCAPATEDALRDATASRAERLEYIALFAQAGYFNMGYALDLFQPPPDVPFE